MSQNILDPMYWKCRLDEVEASGKPLHHAIFVCTLERWNRIAAVHRRILYQLVNSGDRILDAGCGWGRLLQLLPEEWIDSGHVSDRYYGIDLSPDFIDFARRLHGLEWYDRFICSDLLDFNLDKLGNFDWVIVVSMRPMITRNLGEKIWLELQAKLLTVAPRLLLLEYDEIDSGTIIERDR